MSDNINHPKHYTSGNIECIDAITAAVSGYDNPVSGWLAGQIIKYIWRAPLKNGLEDYKKASFYVNRLIKFTEDKQ